MFLFKRHSYFSATWLLPAIGLGLLSAAQLPDSSTRADSLSASSDSTAVHLIPFFNLPGITVTAARTGIGAFLQPARYRTEWWQTSNETQQTLGSLAGAFSKTYGGTGAVHTVAVGGGAAAHTLVLVEGIPLNSPQHGTLDLATIPKGLIGEIEYLPHGGLTQYGSSALSGVVSLEARPIRTGFTAGLGSYGFRQLEVSHGSERGIAGLTIGSTVDQGDFPYSLESVDGRRENNRFRQHYLRATAQISTGGLQHSFRLWLTDNQRGVPGVAWNPNPAASQDDLWVLGSYSAAWQTGPGSHRIQIYLQDQLQEYSDPRLYLDSRHRIFLEGGSYEHSRNLGPGLVSLTRVEGRRERMVSSDAGRHQRYQLDVMQQLLYRLAPRVAVKPAVRVSGENGKSSWVTGDLAFRLTPKGPWWRQVAVIVSRNLRRPGFNDLYWVPGGNPALMREQSRGWVLKSGWLTGPYRLDLQLGRSDYTNLIKWIPGTEGIYRAVNISRARSILALLAFEFKFPGDRATLWAGIDYLDSRNLDPGPDRGKPLRFAPRYAARLKLEGRISERWRLSLSGNERSEYITHYGYPTDTILPAAWNWDLSVTRIADDGTDHEKVPLSKYRSAFTLAIANLADSNIEAVPGYPQPGRSLYVTLHLERK
ncbi:MAG: TonB-dependent receptor plug domain-containing protein [Candidatus Neomarinimicrobiota bacterium]